MISPADARWAHFAQEHRCCWVVESDLCGLLCGHDGKHVPYVPGDYLLPPLIGPLDVLRLKFRGSQCPMCGHTPKRRWEFCASMLSPAAWWRGSGEDKQMTLGALWQFSPCGCEGREILDEQS